VAAGAGAAVRLPLASSRAPRLARLPPVVVVAEAAVAAAGHHRRNQRHQQEPLPLQLLLHPRF
jgi:hypothetical protein